MHNRKERLWELASTFPLLARRGNAWKKIAWILKQFKSQLRSKGNVPDRCLSARLSVLADCPILWASANGQFRGQQYAKWLFYFMTLSVLFSYECTRIGWCLDYLITLFSATCSMRCRLKNDCELWIGKHVERRDRGLFYCSIPRLTWRNGGKPRMTSVNIGYLRTKKWRIQKKKPYLTIIWGTVCLRFEY